MSNSDHRALIKKKTKEFRNKFGKDSFNKGKTKDHKSTKDKLQFWTLFGASWSIKKGQTLPIPQITTHISSKFAGAGNFSCEIQ